MPRKKREEYNQKRPHEALDQEAPASVYERSSREIRSKLSLPEYPNRFKMRVRRAWRVTS